MSAPSPPNADLARLLSELADGTLAAADEDRLAALLEADPAARAKYYDHMLLAALLRREGRRAAARPAADDASPEPAANSLVHRHAPAPPPPRPRATARPRLWLAMLAASVLLGLLLSIGEATGVTRFVPTIIRIATGEGALVIEVEDPAVAVQLDGADIRITGAGIHELRLRPGAHKLVATRNGQPVQDEVVTIEHGGRRVIRITREAAAGSSLTAPASAAAPAAQPSAPLQARKRLLIVLPARGFFYPDFSPISFPLSMHGVECLVASTSTAACQPSAVSPQVPVKPNVLLADAHAADYDAIYFCGGEGIEEFCSGGPAAADARRLIEEALAAQRIVAAAGMGVVVLAEADALRGRRAACYPYGQPPGSYARRIQARGAVCSEEGIVEDGLIVTARAPQDVAAFGQVLLKRLGIEPLPRASPAVRAN